MKIAIKEIVELSTKALSVAGANDIDIEKIIKHCLEEELLGKKSHGFFRVLGIVKILKQNILTKNIEKYDKFPMCVEVDGGNNLGFIVAEKAFEIAIQTNTKHPISITVAKNYVGSTGAMGYYSRILSKHDLISIIFCNSEYAVAPWGGMEAILGTNPISFGIPFKPNPVIIDFATSAKTYGELMLAVNSCKNIPLGVVLDKDGNPSTDPSDANNGCQLPMAEHKGYGLGLVIEILSGIFIGAKAGKEAVLGSDGLVIISFKPDIFVTKEQFNITLQKLLSEISNSKAAPSFKEIKIPGDRCLEIIEEKIKEGFVELDENAYKEILDLANEHK